MPYKKWNPFAEGYTVEDVQRMAAEAKPFKNHEGIEGRFVIRGKRPYERITFEPTAKGKRHPKYITAKEKMRDDWVTEIDGDNWLDYIQRALRVTLP
jgi:hypothetical protein